MPIPTKKRKPLPDESQLALPLAWLGSDDFIRLLQARGVTGIARVRFKPNRSRLISLSMDHRALNLHECFRGAPDSVLDAIATFLGAPHGSAGQRKAVRVMRVWSAGQAPEDPADAPLRLRASAGTPAQQQFLLEAYRQLNHHLFAGRLPDVIPLRLSSRMARRFGHVEYRRVRGEAREIAELALNVDLLIGGNERHLLDTLLHEMAHVEAWVIHGHRGHGAVWRRIARRLGCEVRALSWVRLRRPRNAGRDHVPDVAALLGRARKHAPTAGRLQDARLGPVGSRTAGHG